MKRSHHRSSEERHALPLPPPPSNSNGKRFDSSLGSDTGTSTRESDEGSEERTSVDLSPTQPSIFDSLAAELRAKLNGNGPPLLLPPRDYDTMHRSKGNLAAIELRRCRNKLIVGATTNAKIDANKKHGVSSRGSSGIGSDLAASPERQEGQSSSGLFFYFTPIDFNKMINKSLSNYKIQFTDDDWMLKKRESELKPSGSSLRRANIEKPIQPPVQRIEKPPSYLYPLQKPAYIIPAGKGSKDYMESDNETTDSPPTPPKEEEIKPKLVRPRNLDFKQILNERFLEEKDNDGDQQLSNDERFFRNDSVQYNRSMEKKKLAGHGSGGKNVQRTKSAPTAKEIDEPEEEYRYRYHESKGGYNSNERLRKSRESFDDENTKFAEYTENLTDKQKYHQSLMKKQQGGTHREYYDDGFIRPKESSLRSDIKSSNRNEQIKAKPYYELNDDHTIESKKYRYKAKMPLPSYADDFDGNGTYKEPNNLPYRESRKSPIMRYKSYDDSVEYRDECGDECTSDCEKDFAPQPYPSSKYRGNGYEPNDRPRYRDVKRISPDLHDIPPKDRFHKTKENFRQIERYRSDIDRPYPMEKSNNNHAARRMMPRPDFDVINPPPLPPPPSQPKHYPPRPNAMVEWSSDEDLGRSSPPNVRIIPREHFEKNSSSRMAQSKSLGNLAKGYRHSYAEPPLSSRNAMPRSSGRVGLAAVQPY